MKRDAGNAAPPGASRAEDVGRWPRVVVLAALIPLAVTAVLWRLHVPLGCPGRFVYEYSPVIEMRIVAVPAAIVIAAVLGVGVYLVTRATTAATSQRAGLGGGLLVGAGIVALGLWAYLAPPAHMSQHVFNAHSPSQDGAFVREARHVTDVRAYLRSFPQRALTPPEEMRGTRVVSNPPATTLLALAIDRLVDRWPALRDVAPPAADESIPLDARPGQRQATAVGLMLFWALTALWVAASIPLYWLGRLYAPPPLAAVFSLCCVFSPMTLLFVPGKDPAQLLTVALPLWLWCRALRLDRPWSAGLAGVFAALACTVSLVHVWLAAVVVVATLLSRWPHGGTWRALALRMLVPAFVGAALAAMALYFVCDLNLWATVRAVARAQAEVTRGPSAMPLAWQVLGVPLFLLFVGPALGAIIGAWITRPAAKAPGGPGAAGVDARLGRWLLIGTILVMLGTVGFTNIETPRLWIPFVPLLLLGVLLRWSAWVAVSRRHAVALALVVFVQVAGSALQWSLMDMREAETRLVEERYFH